jgi:hypothetical protein
MVMGTGKKSCIRTENRRKAGLQCITGCGKNADMNSSFIIYNEVLLLNGIFIEDSFGYIYQVNLFDTGIDSVGGGNKLRR